MFGAQAPKGTPVHALGLQPAAIRNPRVPAKFSANATRFSNCPVILGLSLALVCEPAAVPAEKTLASVEQGYTPTASRSRAAKPWAMTAQMALSAVE